MKPITWLRRFANRGHRSYPVAALAFYGPDNRKASKGVLGIIPVADAEPELHKWFRHLPEADLRYDIKLQNAWIEIIRREGVQTLVLLEEINGCPHEEGIDYPLGEECPQCPFWAHRERPIDSPPTTTGGPVAVATYRPDQWEALLASADDRANLEETWEQWNADVEELLEKMRAEGIPFTCVELDVEEINQFCKEQGIPNDGKARANFVLRKAQEGDP
ncbi:MAG TPA: hypothetical protein VGH07_04445 [Chthoniobacterales bacterium]